ncbi:hypothetical protein PC110_g18608 [Phytophthora cactorum]|uniref:Uncharacterized protein n=2 Tax=Phytophthora cactorum TaxID=29920 RepID=A0A329RL60_9STRA|nr:hypothetical protein PC111_g22351 [Phytophthora cactorum]KAG2812053.1 hypothetical protein PC112_g15346 [Phytophthora cactorum]KAG3052227.1 hypothetical protein PC122_g22743 [Phytophthora cactorum]RAW24969.1 hypothetical protein PC110_g18608 [Phytophthora cactorum]
MLPYGVSIEGSAIDSLRVAFIRQGLAPNEVRPAIRAFMMGPPGHINREDVRRAFPVLLQQNPARREQVVDYQPQAGMTRAEEAFEEPAFEPNADEEIIFLPPHRTETGEDTLIQERNKADDPVIEQRAQDEPAQARVPVIIPDDDPREDEAAEQPPRDENHHYP